MAAAGKGAVSIARKGDTKRDTSKEQDVRLSNIVAAKGKQPAASASAAGV